MICDNPFVRMPFGVTKLKALLYEDAKLAATPFGCGQCLHCRINKSREWTHRIMAENSLHGDSLFVTCTYDPEHLPLNDKNQMILVKAHHQEYIKKLRKAGLKIRYYVVGEYGERKQRPHLHYILFGAKFEDVQTIQEKWSYGAVDIGLVTKDSARYVTNYSLKGFNNENRKELYGRVPEFRCMSLKPPIGGEYIDNTASRLKSCVPTEDLPIIKETTIGGYTRHIGRTLTTRLNSQLDKDQDSFDKEFLAYQDKVFEEYDIENIKQDIKDKTYEKRWIRRERHRKTLRRKIH